MEVLFMPFSPPGLCVIVDVVIAVREVRLIQRNGKSRGMAYVAFEPDGGEEAVTKVLTSQPPDVLGRPVIVRSLSLELCHSFVNRIRLHTMLRCDDLISRLLMAAKPRQKVPPSGHCIPRPCM